MDRGAPLRLSACSRSAILLPLSLGRSGSTSRKVNDLSKAFILESFASSTPRDATNFNQRMHITGAKDSASARINDDSSAPAEAVTWFGAKQILKG